MKPTFSVPDEADNLRLAKQWLAVVNLVKEDYGAQLDQSESALGLLQSILDDDLIGNNEYGLQCLGVALGRILATNVAGLDWWVVEDEFGRDLCLCYESSSFRCNPITMISKRVLRGEAVDVRRLYEQAVTMVREKGPAAD